MIPNNIFLIWLGDKKPYYIDNTILAYKQANIDFNVKFIHFSIDDITRIFANAITEDEKILYESINVILSYEKDNTSVNTVFAKLIEQQKICYGKDIVFIQLLSDIFRLNLVNHYGGIYVDCDTFPMKPFDDTIMNVPLFSIRRHYDNGGASRNLNNLGTDNYFIGSEVNAICKYDMQYILQTNNNWWIDPMFIYRKKKFYDCSLKYTVNKKSDFYIEHYCDGNWKLKNGRIRTQKCFLDDMYEH